MNELLKKSAVEQSKALKNKEISAVELTTAAFERIDGVESKIGAFNSLTKDIALATAKKVDEKIDIGQDGYRVIIAGSTHKGEDEIVLDIFKNKLQKYSDIKLLLVPRHTTRLPQIIQILDTLGLNYGFRSKGDTFKDKDVIVLDTMGELSKMYAICHFAFIGGSFNKTGGHNPLEATVYSKPTITGPSIHNFRDIYWLLSRSKAGKIVKTPLELSDYMDKLLSDNEFYKQACEDCSTVFNDQQGALDVVIKELKEIL